MFCLSGLVDRIDLSDEEKLVACEVTSVLHDLGQQYLVTERGHRAAAVQRALAARGLAPRNADAGATDGGALLVR
jgi:hypothetical protein